jgi:nucleoid-associated protein YgaU
MAAIAYPLPRDRVARPPARPPEPRGPAGAERVDRSRRRPPTSAARRRATIRRRLTAIAFTAGLVLVIRPLVLPGGDPLVVPGRVTPAAAAVGTRTYIVQPGDTLWSIARHVHPDQDPRPLMDQLSAQVPGGSLQAGQHLVLP